MNTVGKATGADDHSPPSSAEVEDGGVNASTAPLFMAWRLIKYREIFTLWMVEVISSSFITINTNVAKTNEIVTWFHTSACVGTQF
jgi:hypothetical protein